MAKHESILEKRWLLKMELDLEFYELEQQTLKDIKEGKVVWDEKLRKFVQYDKNKRTNSTGVRRQSKRKL
jgi:hypothetical protein